MQEDESRRTSLCERSVACEDEALEVTNVMRLDTQALFDDTAELGLTAADLQDGECDGQPVSELAFLA